MGRTLLLLLICCSFCLCGVSASAQDKQAEPAPPRTTPQAADDGQAAQTVPMADIHDIRPPEPAGFDPAILWYLAGAVAALAFLAGLFYGWKRRKRSPRMTVTPALPPETEAINGLNALSDVQAIDGKDFYFRLSAILRRYIAGRYGINAPEMTTEELLPKLDKAGPERSLLQSLKSLFHTADPVKFAGQYAVTGQMESDLVFARKFVEQTTPSPENGEA